MEKPIPLPRPGRRYMAAVVLGTALSTLGPAVADAATARAVHDLSRYCTACWRNAHLDPDCWPDCTQEVLARLVERVTPEAWDRVLKDEGEERREFLRAIDTVKKRSQRQRRPSSLVTGEVADQRDARERTLAEERDALNRAAGQLLSSRQRQIIQLSLDGWQVHEVADALRLSPERVSDEKYKAVRRLREHFSGLV